MKFHNYLITSFLAIFIITSCGEEGNEVTEEFIPETPTDFLAGQESKSWQMVSKNGLNPPGCEADNIYTYRTDGSFEMAYGVLKCFQSETGDAIGGTWLFASDNTILQVRREGGLSINYQLNELTNDRLVVQYTIGGTTYEEEYTPVE